ncbi:MAG TPA: DoxX family protein [Noviherbaspirillum sp.]
MQDERNISLGIALLRVALGVMLLAHSVLLKYFVFTLGGTAQYFASIGLPPLLAYIVFAMEAAGGILLILGVGTRWVSLAMLPVLLGATWAHAGNGWVFSAANGGWEYPLYLSVLAVAQFLLGEGAFALGVARFLRPQDGAVRSVTA